MKFMKIIFNNLYYVLNNEAVLLITVLDDA